MSQTKESSEFEAKMNPMSSIKNVIGVMSGKGGVGKSTISVLIAKQLKREGHEVGILDADITGPSIPRLLGIEDQKAIYEDPYIRPVKTYDGIKAISLNLLIEDENQPVIWRGPLLAGAVKQFWSDVNWGTLDYLIIDLPPGTGDVALTAMQSLPITGLVIVSIPQDLVSMIVSKAVNMARKMDTKVLGVVENMSYIRCPDCETKIQIFDNNDCSEFLEEMDLKLLGELPMIKSINKLHESNYEEIEPHVKPIIDKVLEELKVI
ncbi:MAG TPA: Mrp/NBP35 family ATP-binding protein [Thermoanaerobacterales bacterium]|nr:Mrp/NBP35 family ATP-binding protein [Thermoanaerobacterales bacterium]